MQALYPSPHRRGRTDSMPPGPARKAADRTPGHDRRPRRGRKPLPWRLRLATGREPVVGVSGETPSPPPGAIEAFTRPCRSSARVGAGVDGLRPWLPSFAPRGALECWASKTQLSLRLKVSLLF